MADEYFEIKQVRQLIPSSGLWLHVERGGKDAAPFIPVSAIALVDIVSPSPPHFLDQGLLPVTADMLMYGLFERTPFLGLNIRYRIYHDADFKELGVRLKKSAKPRSLHVTPARGDSTKPTQIRAAKPRKSPSSR